MNRSFALSKFQYKMDLKIEIGFGSFELRKWNLLDPFSQLKVSTEDTKRQKPRINITTTQNNMFIFL